MHAAGLVLRDAHHSLSVHIYIMVFNDKMVETEKYNGILEGLFESPTNLEIIT